MQEKTLKFDSRCPQQQHSLMKATQAHANSTASRKARELTPTNLYLSQFCCGIANFTVMTLDETKLLNPLAIFCLLCFLFLQASVTIANLTTRLASE